MRDRVASSWIDEIRRSRRICAPSPTSRHCTLRSRSDGGRLLADRRGRHARGAVAQIDQHPLARRLEPVERGVDRLGAAEHVLDHVGAVQPGRHVAAVADIAVDKGVVMHLVERRHIGIAGELADLARDLELGDAGHELFARLAIGDQIGDRNALQRVLLGEGGDLRAAHDRAVVVDQLADRRHRLELGEPAEIDRRLGMARAHQHAAILGDQRKDVARPDEIRAAGIVVGELADRRGAVVGRDAGRRAVAVIDRDGKGGAVDRVVVGDHRRQVQAPRDLAGQRRADDAAGVADDERHLFRRRMRPRR